MITEFRVGEVFAKALSVLAANFVPFMAIALIVNSPGILVAFYDLQNGSPESEGSSDVLVRLLDVILGPIATGAITFGVIQQLRGQHASFATCLSTGFSRLFPILGVAICVGLATGVGFLCLIIPGFIILAMLWVAIPVAVVEQVGVREALNRSQDLTKDNRLKIVGLFLLLLIFQFGAGLIVGFVGASVGETTLFFVMLIAVNIFASAWQASAQGVSYYYLRSMKESIDIDRIASVFD